VADVELGSRSRVKAAQAAVLFGSTSGAATG
jgi:hypothetical protein